MTIQRHLVFYTEEDSYTGWINLYLVYYLCDNVKTGVFVRYHAGQPTKQNFRSKQEVLRYIQRTYESVPRKAREIEAMYYSPKGYPGFTFNPNGLQQLTMTNTKKDKTMIIEKLKTEMAEVVRCANCKKLHLVESDTYMTVGAVYVGRQGGVLGPQTSAYCRGTECAAEVIMTLANAFGVKHTIGYKQR